MPTNPQPRADEARCPACGEFGIIGTTCRRDGQLHGHVFGDQNRTADLQRLQPGVVKPPFKPGVEPW